MMESSRQNAAELTSGSLAELTVEVAVFPSLGHAATLFTPHHAQHVAFEMRLH